MTIFTTAWIARRVAEERAIDAERAADGEHIDRDAVQRIADVTHVRREAVAQIAAEAAHASHLALLADEVLLLEAMDPSEPCRGCGACACGKRESVAA